MRSLLLLLLLFGVPAPALAQIEFPTADPVKEPKPAESEVSEESAQSALPAPASSGFWDEMEGRVVTVYRQFELEPLVDDGVMRNYVDRMRGFGLDQPRSVSLQALDSPHAPTVDLAARVLEFVGDPEDADKLLEAASIIGDVAVAGTCLESALRLNGGYLPHRAVRLLDHPQRSMRSVVENRLQRAPHDSYQPRLLQLLSFGRDTDSRLRASRLLFHFREKPEVRSAFHAALKDKAVSVAFEAAQALIGEARPDEVEALHQDLLTTEPGPIYAYLVYALLRQQDTLEMLLVDDELLPKLQVCLSDPDLFLSGAAAAALAEYNYRSDDTEGLDVLEREIVHVLVRSVGGVTFYPQYARFSPLGEDSLERITGENFSHTDRSAWLAWFTENHEGFRAVRGQLPLAPEDYDRLLLTWEDTRGRFALGGVAVAEGVEGMRLLGTRQLIELVDLLDGAQLLDTRVLPGTYGDPSADVLARLEIAVGPRRKPMTFRGESGANWLPAVVKQLDAIYESLAWQTLAPTAGAREYVENRLTRWDAADLEARRGMKLELTTSELHLLSDSVLHRWLGHLDDDPGLDPLWQIELSYRLLEELPARVASDTLATSVMHAAFRRPEVELTSTFLDVVQNVHEPLRSDLLLGGLERLGPVAASACLADARLPVRVAAARALGKAGPTGREALLAALSDSNPLVVRMAVRSLGELGDPSVLAELMPFATPNAPKEVRKETLWALGEIGDPGALDVITLAAAPMEDAAVRLAAVEALGKIDGSEVLRTFSQLLEFYAGDALEVAFLRSLEGRGAGTARKVLGEHIDAFDDLVRRRASVAAGRLGMPDAVEPLMDLLPETPHDPELLDALVAATGVDFRDLPDPAGVYAAWWRENGRYEPNVWMERAAANSGMNLQESFDDASIVPVQEAVVSLLALLEDGPAHLRPSVSYYLHELTGVDAPALLGTTPATVVEQVAQSWHAWIEARAQG